MRAIDLSYTTEDGIPVYPGDSPVVLEHSKRLNEHGYNSYILHSGMHAGTHIDLPMHLTKDARFACDIPIEHFIANGVLIDCRNKDNRSICQNIEEKVFENDAVLMLTEFADIRSESYFKAFPVVDEDICDLLISKKIKMLGLETPSPDKPPFLVHRKLLENDICIVENLRNLSALLPDNDKNTREFHFYAVPLKLRAESSLVRAFALEVPERNINNDLVLFKAN